MMATEAVTPTITRADRATSTENRVSLRFPSKLHAALCDLAKEINADEHIATDGRCDAFFGRGDRWLVTFRRAGLRGDLWISFCRGGKLMAVITPKCDWFNADDEELVRQAVHTVAMEMLDFARRGDFELEPLR